MPPRRPRQAASVTVPGRAGEQPGAYHGQPPRQPPRHNRSRSHDQLPSAITNRVPSCHTAPLPSDPREFPLAERERESETVSHSSFSLPSRRPSRESLRYAPLLSRADREIDATTRGNWCASTRGPDYRVCGTKSHLPACSPRRGEVNGGPPVQDSTPRYGSTSDGDPESAARTPWAELCKRRSY